MDPFGRHAYRRARTSLKRVKSNSLAALVCAALVVPACTLRMGSPDPEPGSGASPDDVKVSVGPAGGTVVAPGLTLRIPGGALDHTEEITVHRSTAAPAGIDARSSTYVFGPSGLTFKRPILAIVDAPPGELGTLYWSKAGDEGKMEPVGLAVRGKARAFVTHFSQAVVGSGTMPSAVASSSCVCRASADPYDLVCPTDPGDGGHCADFRDFQGTNGASCSGFGPRREEKQLCFCRTAERDYLCPLPMEFSPQRCPSAQGFGSFEGKPGMSCSGYINDFTPEKGDFNRSGSGTMVDCSDAGTMKSESVDGTLEACDDLGPAPGGTNPDSGAQAFPGDGLAAPGTCTASEQKALQDDKDAACGALRACKAFSGKSTTQADLDANMAQWEKNYGCADARIKVMDTCFRGGDTNHNGQLQQVVTTIHNCEKHIDKMAKYLAKP